MKKKIAWFVTHPIQYYSPMYVKINEEEDIDLTVYYFSDFSVKGYQDKEFGKTIQWDIPLLDGYTSEILKNYSWKNHGSFFSYINFSIFQKIKNNNYDLVVIHGWNTFSHMLILISCLITSTPYAIRGDTNSFNEHNKKGIKSLIRKVFLTNIFKYASAIFYIGEQNKKFYQLFSVQFNKLFKMPFAVDNDYFQNYLKKVDIEKEKALLNIEKDMKVILFSGKLTFNKQCNLLINALENMKQEKYILLIVGDGDERSKLEELAIKKQINIHFLGFINQKEIPKYYWLSDIFILPSKYEAWGLAINEAMNCKCAIIVSDSVGAKDDLIKDNGFIFDKSNKDELAHIIHKLINDEDLLQSCQLNSSNLIKSYSFEEDVKALKLYFKEN
jgi:glycosyltransferase involved in cell wall biosynthesis